MTTKKNHASPRGAREGMVHLALSVAAKADDGAVGADGAAVERAVDVIASTASKDREGEIVQQDWMLDGVESVPVFWEHNYALGWGLDPYDPRASLPIGKATNIRVEAGALKARLEFVDERANPLGPMVFEGFRQGSIRSVSVGFVPHDVRAEVHEGEEVLVLSANELLEISACSIGVNRDAGVVEAKTFAALRAQAAEETKTMKIRAKAEGSAQAAQSTETATSGEGAASASSTEESKADPMQCDACKATAAAGSKFCAMCGKAFPEPAAAEPDGDEAGKALRTLTGKATTAEAIAAVVAWKSLAETAGATAAKAANDSAARREAEVAELLEGALRAGKIPKSKRSFYLELVGADEHGKGADPKRLRALVDALPVEVPVGAKAHAAGTAADLDAPLLPEERQVLKQTGMSEDEYRKAKAKQKAEAAAAKGMV